MLIAGNWKMNLTAAEAVDLAGQLRRRLADVRQVELAVFPPAVYLAAVAKELAGSNIAVGAQNMFYEPKGAYTGEISAGMIRDCGGTMVILGHSERRHVIGEDDAMIHRKLLAALEGRYRS